MQFSRKPSLGMAGRPSLIQILFSRVPDPYLGRNKLSRSEAESDGLGVARVADVPKWVRGGSVLAGRSADLGKDPSVTMGVGEGEERERERERKTERERDVSIGGGGGGGREREWVVCLAYAGGPWLV